MGIYIEWKKESFGVTSLKDSDPLLRSHQIVSWEGACIGEPGPSLPALLRVFMYKEGWVTG